jgi:cyclohexa-1,5-dienecarbonyl-CoA hydratase
VSSGVSSQPIAERIVVGHRGRVAWLEVNRPPMNILDMATTRELRGAVETLAADATTALVEIRGAGDRAFSAGADIREHFPEQAPEMLREFHALIRAVWNCSRPTVAVVRGLCLGGGMELAMACDFIVASDDARFGQPEIKVGAFPPVAAVLLPRLMAPRRALEMILAGDPITGVEAQRLGLVNRAVAAAQLEETVGSLEASLLAQSAAVVAVARRAARLGSGESLETALRESERLYLEELIQLEDATEGLRAFLEKRPPSWKGA